MEQQQGASYADLARGERPQEPTDPDRFCRVPVSNVWLTDGKGPFSGEFILRVRSQGDQQQIGLACANLTGGTIWGALPPGAQATYQAAASLLVLGGFYGGDGNLPAWYAKSAIALIPEGLAQEIMGQYEGWRAESFREGEGAGPEAARRPVVGRPRPLGGAVRDPA